MLNHLTIIWHAPYLSLKKYASRASGPQQQQPRVLSPANPRSHAEPMPRRELTKQHPTLGQYNDNKTTDTLILMFLNPNGNEISC